MENVCCETCAWHDDFSWVCSNGLSEACADFTYPEDFCIYWEEKEEVKNK